MNYTKRLTFNFLDVIGDIGGMMFIISSTIALWLRIWNYRHMDNYLVSQLFRAPEQKINRFQKGKIIEVKRFSNFAEYFMDLIPNKFLCCRKSSY